MAKLATNILLATMTSLVACTGSNDSSPSDDPGTTPKYVITNLSLGGTTDHRSNSVSINDLDQVIGNDVNLGEYNEHGFFFDGTQVHDVGTLGGDTSTVVDLNNAGQVVGNSDTAGVGSESERHTFIYENQELLDLDAQYGANSEAHAINDAGHVVGALSTPTGVHAFVFDGTSIIDLGTLNGLESNAYDINNAGQIVGSSATNGYLETHAFLYNNNTLQDLGTLGGQTSIATHINESGLVAGYSDTDPDPLEAIFHSFLYQNDQMVDLGTLGGTDSFVSGLNNSGQVIGWSHTGETSTSGDKIGHAFIYDETGMQDLGALGGISSSAEAINENGVVVGTYRNEGGDLETSLGRAFIYEDGAMRDLNELIDPTLGIVLYEAQAVSNNGSIVAQSNVGIVLLSENSPLPSVGPINMDPAWLAVDTPFTVTAAFTDENETETHTAIWSWGDGTPNESGLLVDDSGSGQVSAQHEFTEPGTYYINVQITDSSGLMSQVSKKVEVNVAP